MTDFTDAHDVSQAFNASTERKHWSAVRGGSRSMPTVIFKSATSMVELTFFPANGAFLITFKRTQCVFADYMASAHAAVAHVLSAMKAAGVAVPAPLDAYDGVLRVQYDPATKSAYVSIADTEDDWQAMASPYLTNRGDIVTKLAEEDEIFSVDAVTEAD